NSRNGSVTEFRFLGFEKLDPILDASASLPSVNGVRMDNRHCLQSPISEPRRRFQQAVDQWPSIERSFSRCKSSHQRLKRANFACVIGEQAPQTGNPSSLTQTIRLPSSRSSCECPS